MALAGCGGSDPEPTTTEVEPTTTSSTTTTTAAEVELPLEPRWYLDSDDNAIPDFIEKRIGSRPKQDDCLPDRCNVKDGEPLRIFREGQDTLLILDSSGSMAGSAGGFETKLDAAKQALKRYSSLAPRATDRLGLMVYGHKGSNDEADKQESCNGIDVFSAIGEFRAAGAKEALQKFSPTGFTPLAGSLEQAKEEFEGRDRGVNRVILLTDGIETCGGDPVSAARELKRSGVDVKVDVVGFDIGTKADQDALRKIAKAGDGSYVSAGTSDQLRTYFDRLLEQRTRLRALNTCLTLSAAGVATCAQNIVADAQFEITNFRDDARESGEEERADAIDEISDQGQDADVEASMDRVDEVERQLKHLERRIKSKRG
jgi:D-amino-acid dehydrogenase/Ca-activated chloride channel family protein